MRRRIKDKVLKGITFIAGITWLFTACCMDSENINIVIAINAICMVWLVLMAVANMD